MPVGLPEAARESGLVLAMETLYKITGPNGECLNGGSGTWSLPVNGLPGDWWTVDGPVVPCRNGLHVTNAANLRGWMSGRESRVWLVETGGEVIDAGTKYACQAVRLLREVTVPDFGAIDATYTAKRDRVRARQRRDIEAAQRAHPLAAGSDYAARVYNVKGLPAGHPLRERAAAIDAARKARDAAVMAADLKAGRALGRIDRAHSAAIDAAMASL